MDGVDWPEEAWLVAKAVPSPGGLDPLEEAPGREKPILGPCDGEDASFFLASCLASLALTMASRSSAVSRPPPVGGRYTRDIGEV